jgi:hypothetical protein
LPKQLIGLSIYSMYIPTALNQYIT